MICYTLIMSVSELKCHFHLFILHKLLKCSHMIFFLNSFIHHKYLVTKYCHILLLVLPDTKCFPFYMDQNFESVFFRICRYILHHISVLQKTSDATMSIANCSISFLQSFIHSFIH